MQQDSSDPTGVRDDSPRGNKEVTRARNRKANAALQLRVDGQSWEDIAQILGFPTARAAFVATEKALENELKSPESREFMRKVAGDRLDKVLKSLMPIATNSLKDDDGNPIDHPEHLGYADRVLKYVDRQARLWGFDAPTEFTINTPTLAEIEAWVGEVTQQSVPAVEEADLFGDTVPGEVVESRATSS